MAWRGAVRDRLRLLQLSAVLLAGRRYWLPALLPLVWPAFQAFLLVSGGREQAFDATAAQGTLIGVPLSVLAMFLGVRVIAGEVDHRRLEIAYTVPGGSHRVWLGKLGAAWAILIGSELLLAVVVWAFFTPFPLWALYGALQAASLYLVLSMGLATLFKGEVAGAMVTSAVLAANGVFTGFGDAQFRVSPLWNPARLGDADPSVVLAWTVQNRIGFALAILAVTALAFGRAENREKMLGG
jgi:hypothetical protein